MATDTVALWKRVTPQVQDELVEFWLRHRALPSREVAEQRAQQAVAIGRDDDGAIWGVSTASLRVLPRLRQPVYAYRQFFAASHRGRGAAREFAIASRAILEAYNASLAAPESLGVLLEFENRDLGARYTGAVESGFVFIGYSPRGFAQRISYFDGAQLAHVGLPAQVRRRA
ncbi:hypothetical protein [Cognatilysobacter terrigena]|uniref:hypothetical protein n=1 Tax=Cognatilysobacter terrigena TaxID=2488749 RepID=UPI00105EAA43|nr:hypothetical protein [Lysobacter terrigena]